MKEGFWGFFVLHHKIMKQYRYKSISGYSSLTRDFVLTRIGGDSMKLETRKKLSLVHKYYFS